MAKVAVQVDLKLLQSLINTEEKNKEWTGEIRFFEEIAKQYNICKGAEYEEITASIIYIRRKAGLITANVKAGRRGKELGPLTEEHKEKLKAGKRNRQSRAPSLEVQKAFKERHKGDTKLLSVYADFCKKPTFKKMMRLNCAVCMGGFKHNDNTINAIRHCTSPLCIFWPNRGYK